jgi:hypothetical protein
MKKIVLDTLTGIIIVTTSGVVMVMLMALLARII